MSSRTSHDDGIRGSILRLLAGTGIVAADIGARGDVPETWLPLDGIATVVSFEPDLEACARLEATYASRGNGEHYRIVPVALASSNERRTLHVTASGGGSSLFPVDTPMIRAYTNDEYLFPLQTREIETKNAREVFLELGHEEVHLLKLDIQGGELEVLQSLAGSLLSTTLAVEFEVALQGKAPGHPLFSDLDEFMRSSGFQLFDAEPVRVHRTLRGSRARYLEEMLGVHVSSPSVAGRAWELDVLYMRTAESISQSADSADIRRLAVCQCAYGLFTEALHAISTGRAAGVLDERNASEMVTEVIAWHRSAHYRWWHGFSSPARLLRALAGLLGIQRTRVRGALTLG